MTLPFRRRHHDIEGTHDRARALGSQRFLESLDADDEAWLNRHLEACTECRTEQDAFAANRELLRSLRDKPIEPPRDLWAKTAAALDQEAGRRGPVGAERRAGGGAPSRPWWRSMQAGAAAGALVLLVVIGAVFLQGAPSPITPAGSQNVAERSLDAGPTPITVAAAPIPLLRPGSGGSFSFVLTDVDAVCPHSRPQCVPPPTQHEGSTVQLQGARAETVTISPHNDQLVFESDAGTAGQGKIYVVPVPSSGTPTPPPASPSAPANPSVGPSSSTSGSPTPIETPPGAIEIASGVTVVGEVAYSEDGQWLAFSAAPNDASTGPDLYVYSVGAGVATAVTSNHQTYFSTWLGSRILASEVQPPPSEPAASPGKPGASNEPGATGQGNGHGQPIEANPSSFLLDPATGARTDLSQPNVWMPVVDPKGRFVVYWSGTLRSTDGVAWQLGSGQLVLDGWAAAPETPAASAAGGSAAPATSAAPESSPAVVGPAGHAAPVVTSHVEDFRAQFDPEGVHLAVWVGEHAAAADGRLHLVVIDPGTGTIKAEAPLPGVPALRRFSIDANRLAWVSPSGQDGQESSLQVLGWDGDSFGEIHSEPAPNLLILR